MLKGSKFFALSLALLPALVQAQRPLYAQCGGTGWTGETTCVSGAVCEVINQWYHQCLPGSNQPQPPCHDPTPPSLSPPPRNPLLSFPPTLPVALPSPALATPSRVTM
ncbi:acetyl xylan esterase [Coprinopsis cinerea AmutBmut pab1-1]|nr:acetyl xylan esterase [Coprinopsis cinerea AmutBmut pab1-1]